MGRMTNAKEIRNPNIEIRNKFEAENSNDGNYRSFEFSVFGFLVCFGFRFSYFGFPASFVPSL